MTIGNQDDLPHSNMPNGNQKIINLVINHADYQHKEDNHKETTTQEKMSEEPAPVHQSKQQITQNGCCDIPLTDDSQNEKSHVETTSHLKVTDDETKEADAQNLSLPLDKHNQIPPETLKQPPADLIMKEIEESEVTNLAAGQDSKDDCTIITNKQPSSDSMKASKDSIAFSNDQGDAEMIFEDSKLENPELQTKVQIHDQKAREMLEKLRDIVSNPSHDFKSKFNNISFTKSAQGLLSAFNKASFKPISTEDQPSNANAITKLNFGFRQSHIDNANNQKKLGLSPKIFPKKLATVQNPSKGKGIKKLASSADLKSKSLVSYLTRT